MKLIATVIIKSEYNGKEKSKEEILQGFEEFLIDRIDANIVSIKIEEDNET